MNWIRTLTPFGKGLGLGVLVLLLLGIVYLGLKHVERAEDKDNANLVTSGVVQERAASRSEALNNVEKARDAVDRPSDAARSNVCTKYDRNCPERQ